MMIGRVFAGAGILALALFLTACESNRKFVINSTSFDTYQACRGAEYSWGRCTDYRDGR